jgi:hypothetical protein
MLRRIFIAAALMGAGLLASGCATSRSEISLAAPPPSAAPATTAAAAPGSGRIVAIRTVTDARGFEAAPTDPSTPSIGTEGGDVRERAVGRKRNTYGRALGDVLLPEGETVTGTVRDNLAAAFRQAGYNVVDANNAPAETILVDVEIKQFWSWFQPGFWAITLNANIETNLTVAEGQSPRTISVHVERQGQAATDGAWRQVLQEAVAAYRTEAATQVNQPPF